MKEVVWLRELKEMRDFTQGDWMAFSGASNFETEQPPRVYEYGHITVIAAGRKLEVILMDENLDIHSYWSESCFDERYLIDLAERVIKETKTLTFKELVGYGNSLFGNI